MTAFEAEMRHSLRLVVKKAIYDYTQMERTKWIDACMGQCGIVGAQVRLWAIVICSRMPRVAGLMPRDSVDFGKRTDGCSWQEE